MKKFTYLNSRKLLLTGLIAALAVLVLAAGQPPAGAADQSSIMLERISQRKNTYKIQLSAIEQSDITKKCPLAQTALATVKNQDVTVRANRKKVYDGLSTRLASLIASLKSQKIQTTGLTNAQAKFQRLINTYYDDDQQYKTAVDDLLATNCATDPLGFKVSLLDTRQLRAKLITDAAAIKNYQTGLIAAINGVKATLGNK